MQNLAIALVQHDIKWHQPIANKTALEKKLNAMEFKANLIVLPEMFTTGFTMSTQQMAEPEPGPTLEWMQKIANTFNATVTGSIIVKLPEGVVNRLYWVAPSGAYQTYDKRHLFRMAEEDNFFKSGSQNPVFQVNQWRIKPLICYDLRFPVWSRNTSNIYDALLYVANWPKARINAWNTLLQARGIENLSYSLGVNRVGTDGNQISYNGHSAAFSFNGKRLTPVSSDEDIFTIILNKNNLEEYRKSFPAYLDADSFNVTT